LILLADFVDTKPNWLILAPVIIGALAVWYLLPTYRTRPRALGCLAGVLALVGFGGFLCAGLGQKTPETIEALLFFAFSGMAIFFAGLMVTSKAPARSALSFAMVVLSTCGLFLLLAAPFLSAATVIIYAGAIVVTFLFVIMLSPHAGSADLRSREPMLSVVAGFLLLGTLLVGLVRVYDHRAVDGVIEEAKRLAKSDKIDARYASLGDADAEHLDSESALSATAKKFTQDARQALDRLSIGAPHSKEDQHLTDHALVQEVESAINGLELLGFRFNDHDDIKANCNRIASGLEKLKDLRERAAKPVDVVTSPYGEVKNIEAGPRKLPANNVSAIGRVLFTDHLLAVELAGTLLLVATVGAIAIAHDRREKRS
jgi:NADH-quinone oxidoreductase subunit J